LGKDGATIWKAGPSGPASRGRMGRTSMKPPDPFEYQPYYLRKRVGILAVSLENIMAEPTSMYKQKRNGILGLALLPDEMNIQLVKTIHFNAGVILRDFV
jgi:hypothetical protein